MFTANELNHHSTFVMGRMQQSRVSQKLTDKCDLRSDHRQTDMA